MRVVSIVLGAMSALIIAGCAQKPSQQSESYIDMVYALPAPETQEQRDRACSYLRSEIARMESIAMAGNSTLPRMYAINIQVQSRRNIAALEATAAEFRCRAAFGSGTQEPQSKIESCVASCKENTSRTPEQCFDACNR